MAVPLGTKTQTVLAVDFAAEVGQIRGVVFSERVCGRKQ
jgi:hypothetical protein